MAHCSYGPWQIMFTNADAINSRMTPESMLDPLHALPITVGWMRRVVGRGARNVRDIADAWNSGTHYDKIIPVAYIKKVEKLYGERVDPGS